MTPLDAFAIAAVALFLKMWAMTLVQGHQRLRHKVFVLPEDARHFGTGQAARAELPLVDRAGRVLRNDLENVPTFLFLLLAYVELGCWEVGAWVYAGAFVASRVVHAVAYLRAAQPLRNRAYLVGLLVCFVVAGHVVVGVW